MQTSLLAILALTLTLTATTAALPQPVIYGSELSRRNPSYQTCLEKSCSFRAHGAALEQAEASQNAQIAAAHVRAVSDDHLLHPGHVAAQAARQQKVENAVVAQQRARFISMHYDEKIKVHEARIEKAHQKAEAKQKRKAEGGGFRGTLRGLMGRPTAQEVPSPARTILHKSEAGVMMAPLHPVVPSPQMGPTSPASDWSSAGFRTPGQFNTPRRSYTPVGANPPMQIQ